MVGVPVLGLLGILEAGRGIRAPRSVGGEWSLTVDPVTGCANPPGSILWQRAFNISQSGTEALITLSDGRATTLEATVNGTTLTAKPLTATIAGNPDARTLEGHMRLDGCAPVAFRAVRQTPQKRGE
jgi:hypothetical protein